MEEKVNQASKLLAKRAAQVQGGGARAAVLGVNDGLVSTLCLVTGVAAAGGDAKAVLIAGLAGLLAGAISMAAGEWISVKAQVELFQGVLDDLREIVKTNKPLLAASLARDFQRRGIDAKTAVVATKEVAKDSEQFLAMYAAQVMGVKQDELGSPITSALSSFLLFTAGSIVPLLPWLLSVKGMTAILVAATLTGIGGMLVGGYTARSSGKNIVYGAFRQLTIIIFATLVTYGIGWLFGVVTS